MDADASGLKNKIMFKNIFRKQVVVDHEKQLADWEKSGRSTPPPHIVKQNAIKEYQKKFNIQILIETGTYLGDMMDAQRNDFRQLFSIELSEKLYKRAQKRFKDQPHIMILHGDSGVVLNRLLPKISEPALFWLDGHYSGGITAKGVKDCPVVEELETILTSNLPHTILIDDARLFNGTNDYPTVEEINHILKNSGKDYLLEVKEDIIRITPKEK
jgi:hypothetical protein